MFLKILSEKSKCFCPDLHVQTHHRTRNRSAVRQSHISPLRLNLFADFAGSLRSHVEPPVLESCLRCHFRRVPAPHRELSRILAHLLLLQGLRVMFRYGVSKHLCSQGGQGSLLHLKLRSQILMAPQEAIQPEYNLDLLHLCPLPG